MMDQAALAQPVIAQAIAQADVVPAMYAIT